MPWTQSTDPVNANAWTGNCNDLDLFTPTVPTEPPSFSQTPGVVGTDVYVLEGFEFPIEMYNGTNQTLWTKVNGGAGSTITISTGVRSGGVTAGHGLSMTATSTAGSLLSWFIKRVASNYQYYRMYFKISSFTNTRGFHSSYPLFGWTDSTGYRSIASLVFPATNGANPRIGVETDVPGGGVNADGTTALVVDTWYRAELVTEIVDTGVGMYTTVNLYEGDSTTLIESVQCQSSAQAGGGYAFFGMATTHGGNAVTVVFDDLRIQTAALTLDTVVSNAPLHGPGGVWAMYPKSNGAVAWTPLSGSNFENVQEFPLGNLDGDTTYNSATGASALLDVFNVAFHPTGTMPTTNKDIIAVMTNFSGKNVSGTARAIQAAYSDALGTVYTGDSRLPIGSTYQTTSTLFLIYEDPLPVEFAGEQGIGYNWTASGVASNHRISAVWGLMDIKDRS